VTATPAIALYRSSGWHEIGRVSFELADEQLDELVLRGPADSYPRSRTPRGPRAG
jgi:hypothetical protein